MSFCCRSSSSPSSNVVAQSPDASPPVLPQPPTTAQHAQQQQLQHDPQQHKQHTQLQIIQQKQKHAEENQVEQEKQQAPVVVASPPVSSPSDSSSPCDPSSSSLVCAAAVHPAASPPKRDEKRVAPPPKRAPPPPASLNAPAPRQPSVESTTSPESSPRHAHRAAPLRMKTGFSAFGRGGITSPIKEKPPAEAVKEEDEADESDEDHDDKKDAAPSLHSRLQSLLPPPSHPLHFVRLNFLTHISQNNSMVLCDFVAQSGRSLILVDIRKKDEVVGQMGYIPGVDWFPGNSVFNLPSLIDKDALTVIISQDDAESTLVAKQLQEKGLRFVGAMRGGMKAWKFMGYSTIRDPSILERKGKLQVKSKPSQSASSKTILLEEITGHIGDPLNIQWLKMAAFLVHGRHSCVDGRDDSGVVGTPGGDAGEFILVLSVLEQLCDKRFTYKEVAELLARRLDAFGRFYMHTDLHALEKLQSKMRADPILSAVLEPLFKNPLDYRAWMRSPPMQYRDAIMKHQLAAEHIGCGHLRLMLTKSHLYGVRPKLVLHALKAFFTARWNGAIECEYMALSGKHQEGAVINVHLEQKVATFTRVPLISPSCHNRQLFVNHPQVASYLRQQEALFFTMQTDIVPLGEGAKDELYPKIEALASAHLTLTISALAAGLPLYDVRFGEEDGDVVFTVKQLNTRYDDDAEEEEPSTVSNVSKTT